MASAPLSFYIEHAFNKQSKEAIARAQSEFINALLIIPTNKSQTSETGELNNILMLKEGNLNYIPVFSLQSYLKHWADSAMSELSFIHSRGYDLIDMLPNNSVLSLDIGQKHYKEFSPEEIDYLKRSYQELLK